jgi:small GTP-binding protein
MAVAHTSGVGKTCLVLRYTSDQFSSTFITTIGIDYKTKKLKYKNQNIGMQVWDTAGQERFRSITGSYTRGAHGLVLVYDITDLKSFENVHVWITTIVDNAEKEAGRNILKILVGNKSDLKSERVVSTEDGKKLASEFGMEFIEASAKDGTNVSTAFETMGRMIVDVLEEKEQKSSSSSSSRKGVGVNVNKSSSSSSGCC